MQIYKVIRPEDIVYVSILQNKNDRTYSFVNLTKGHICPCRFLSEEEALQDLEEQKQKGKVVSYEMCSMITGREGKLHVIGQSHQVRKRKTEAIHRRQSRRLHLQEPWKL